MARLTDIIEEFLKQLLLDTGGTAEIQRNELANQFHCVPSQISYVIETRFTNERGYYVESRRGGGGHIKITRATIDTKGNYIMHIINTVGNCLSYRHAEVFINNFVDYNIISTKESLVLKSALSDKALIDIEYGKRDHIRASILKNILINLIANY